MGAEKVDRVLAARHFLTSVAAMPVDTIENVSTLTTKANVYFDGKAVSHGFVTADGQNKSVGVVLGPNTELTFTTGPAEVMTCVGGGCEYRLKDTKAWVKQEAGDAFSIEGNSSFDIKVPDQYHYICSYA
jgi:uncharacterized protein YaiE (UPF0345 family)